MYVLTVQYDVKEGCLKGEVLTEEYACETLKKCMALYRAGGENHDLAKYSARRIVNVVNTDE